MLFTILLAALGLLFLLVAARGRARWSVSTWRAVRRDARRETKRRRALGLSAQRVAHRDRAAWRKLSHG